MDQSIDIWSFGVSLYKMAVAYFPTNLRNYKYGSGPIPYREKDWKELDFANARDLIDACLMIKPEERITVDEALAHPWFDGVLEF